MNQMNVLIVKIQNTFIGHQVPRIWSKFHKRVKHSSTNLDEFVLFCTLCIANNQAISDENSSCLIIHLFLNTEDDSRALILL